MKEKKYYQRPVFSSIFLELEDCIASGSAITLHTEGTDGRVDVADWKTEETAYDEWF